MTLDRATFGSDKPVMNWYEIRAALWSQASPWIVLADARTITTCECTWWNLTQIPVFTFCSCHDIVTSHCLCGQKVYVICLDALMCGFKLAQAYHGRHSTNNTTSKAVDFHQQDSHQQLDIQCHLGLLGLIDSISLCSANCTKHIGLPTDLFYSVSFERTRYQSWCDTKAGLIWSGKFRVKTANTRVESSVHCKDQNLLRHSLAIYILSLLCIPK